MDVEAEFDPLCCCTFTVCGRSCCRGVIGTSNNDKYRITDAALTNSSGDILPLALWAGPDMANGSAAHTLHVSHTCHMYMYMMYD